MNDKRMITTQAKAPAQARQVVSLLRFFTLFYDAQVFYAILHGT